MRQRPVLPVSASRANYGVIAAQGAPSAPAPPHTRPAPAAHAASSEPDDSGRVERLLLHARTASWGGQWLCRYAVAPLPRTASSASSSNCAFSKARKALYRPCSRPTKRPRSQTRAFLPPRASVRCRKDREGFSESGRGPPSTNVFRRCGGMLRAEPLARSGKGAFPQPRKHSPPDDRRWAFDSRCPSPRGVLHPPASLETNRPSPKAQHLIPRHSHFFFPPLLLTHFNFC